MKLKWRTFRLRPVHESGKSIFTLCQITTRGQHFCNSTFCQRRNKCLFNSTQLRSVQLNWTDSVQSRAGCLECRQEEDPVLPPRGSAPTGLCRHGSNSWNMNRPWYLLWRSWGNISWEHRRRRDLFCLGENRGKLHGTGRIWDEPWETMSIFKGWRWRKGRSKWREATGSWKIRMHQDKYRNPMWLGIKVMSKKIVF